MFSEVPFATFANYHSKGSSEEARRSRGLCGGVKSGAKRTLTSLADALSGPAAAPIKAFLANDRDLVPVPGSGKTAPGNLWVPALLCEALQAAGFGDTVSRILIRETAVPKSAFAAPGQRPTVRRHFETMLARKELFAPHKITLVDDVLTKGSTMMGAYLRLREAYPEADIKVFAVFKTCNMQPDIDKVVEPIVGRLRYQEMTDTVWRLDNN